MGLFEFGKRYTREDLDIEVEKLRDLYQQAMGAQKSNKSQYQLKKELSEQLHKLLVVCRKGGFNGMETVEWPCSGCYTSLRNVTPPVQVQIDSMC